jgi:hypothetical protein
MRLSNRQGGNSGLRQRTVLAQVETLLRSKRTSSRCSTLQSMRAIASLIAEPSKQAWALHDRTVSNRRNRSSILYKHANLVAPLTA